MVQIKSNQIKSNQINVQRSRWINNLSAWLNVATIVVRDVEFLLNEWECCWSLKSNTPNSSIYNIIQMATNSPSQKEAYSTKAIEENNRVVYFSRIFVSLIAGCAAGILGLTGSSWFCCNWVSWFVLPLFDCCNSLFFLKGWKDLHSIFSLHSYWQCCSLSKFASKLRIILYHEMFSLWRDFGKDFSYTSLFFILLFVQMIHVAKTNKAFELLFCRLI
jgi:hypothetical protein